MKLYLVPLAIVVLQLAVSCSAQSGDNSTAKSDNEPDIFYDLNDLFTNTTNSTREPVTTDSMGCNNDSDAESRWGSGLEPGTSCPPTTTPAPTTPPDGQ